MTSLSSLPAGVLEEIYLSLPKSLLLFELQEALVADEKNRLEQEGFSGIILKDILADFKTRLSKLGPISVAELAYEACVSNNTFDTELNQVWVDRQGKFKLNPNDLYKHNFVDSMFSLAEKAQGENVTQSDRRNLLSQIDTVCSAGAGSVSLGYAQMSISFNADKRQVKYTLGESEGISVSQSDYDRLSSSFSKFVDRCRPKTGSTLSNSSSMGM